MPKFKVYGASEKTGKDLVLLVEAASPDKAEAIARQRKIMVSRLVEVVEAGTPATEPVAPPVSNTWNVVRVIGIGMMAVSILLIAIAGRVGNENTSQITTAYGGTLFFGMVLFLTGWIGRWKQGQSKSLFSFGSWSDAIALSALFAFGGILMALVGESGGGWLILIALSILGLFWLLKQDGLRNIMGVAGVQTGPGQFAVSGVRKSDGSEHVEIIEASTSRHARAKGEQKGLIVAKVKKI